MRRTTALAFGIVALASATQRAAADDEDEDEVTIEDDAKPARKVKKTDAGDERQKQNLSGRGVEKNKTANVFERDRFFVDKTDTAKTENGTLIQGSVTSTTFGYTESGGTITILNPTANSTVAIPSNSQFSRVFTDLRLQTDFRHIAGSRWEGRVDVRGRAVTTPGTVTLAYVTATPNSVQSGQQGASEFEIKELWLVRNGVRSDVFLGRQFIPDLGGLKIDGLRVDYASSAKFTLLGFGGLYPLRGSRSIDTDYTPLLSNPDVNGVRSDAGRFTAAGGFGAAYRTPDAYGAFGGVVLAPLSSESPRVYGTSTGYWRYGAKLDFYHFAILDLVGSNAVNAGLTNLSLGLNYKPDQRLRGTLSFNRVDTETLNVQAQAYLQNPDNGLPVIQNEAYLLRIATNQARASLSAGLGPVQRFELTAAVAYRYRGDVTLQPPGAAAMPITLPAASSAEVYGSFTDRQSVADLRLGVDGSRIFRVGSNAYQRTATLALRVFAARMLANGKGEWEAELGYSDNKDDNAGMTCTMLISCFGSAQSKVISLGGNLFYRFNRDWFGMASLFLNRTSITHVEMAASTEDPAITGLSGFLRIAYRF